MDEKPNTGLAKKAASAATKVAVGTGHVAGWGSKRVASFIGLWVVMPATVVIVGFYAVTGKWPWTKPVELAKVQMSKAEIKEEQLACGLRMGWEDGKTDQERLFALIAGYNLSNDKDMKIGLCDVAYNFWTLRAKGNPTSQFRPWALVDKITPEWTKAQLSQFSTLREDFENYLRDPTELRRKYPWLECVFAYKRTTYPWPITPRPDSKLDTTARLMYTSPSGAKYYCPK